MDEPIERGAMETRLGLLGFLLGNEALSGESHLVSKIKNKIIYAQK